MITVDTSGAEGFVFDGKLPYDVVEQDVEHVPKTRTNIMLNIATPSTAFEKSFLPNRGVGLAREEFIIAASIGIHPLAILNYKKLDRKLKRAIDERTRGWSDKRAFYVDNLVYGIAKIAAAFHPHPVIVRFSDFKTNEYRTLLGGDQYEPHEENPMIGWRGASRYYDPAFAEAFALEIEAIRVAREDMGLDNVIPMVPFCRTPEEGRKTLELMAKGDLVGTTIAKRDGWKGKTVPVYVMCEIPSNVLLADEFLDLFDGMSIGSNDLTQLVLGIDRDAGGTLSRVGDANDPAVKKMITEAIAACKKRGKYIGICGQAPSDYPEFAAFLVEQGIDSISLNPDTVIKTTIAIAAQEQKQK
jgi:pyruvate,water dikinase